VEAAQGEGRVAGQARREAWFPRAVGWLRSRWFNVASLLVIFVNAIILASNNFFMTQEESDSAEAVVSALTVLFGVELVVEVVAWGPLLFFRRSITTLLETVLVFLAVVEAFWPPSDK
jgi:hypothetical protein